MTMVHTQKKQSIDKEIYQKSLYVTGEAYPPPPSSRDI